MRRWKGEVEDVQEVGRLVTTRKGMWEALVEKVSFFFNDAATAEIYTLSLHDALPISEHLADAILLGGADAALAASIFHYGEYTIHETKQVMHERGVPVRL